jgi:hypothetical protein
MPKTINFEDTMPWVNYHWPKANDFKPESLSR